MGVGAAKSITAHPDIRTGIYRCLLGYHLEIEGIKIDVFVWVSEVVRLGSWCCELCVPLEFFFVVFLRCLILRRSFCIATENGGGQKVKITKKKNQRTNFRTSGNFSRITSTRFIILQKKKDFLKFIENLSKSFFVSRIFTHSLFFELKS